LRLLYPAEDGLSKYSSLPILVREPGFQERNCLFPSCDLVTQLDIGIAFGLESLFELTLNGRRLGLSAGDGCDDTAHQYSESWSDKKSHFTAHGRWFLNNSGSGKAG
jgi:hypothetical protein